MHSCIVDWEGGREGITVRNLGSMTANNLRFGKSNLRFDKSNPGRAQLWYSFGGGSR